MRTQPWMVLLLLLASIGCRSSAKKLEDDTRRTPVAPTAAAVVVPVPPVIVETPSVPVEVPPEVPIEGPFYVPLTPEEEVVVAALEARIVALESALADGKTELRETLARLRAKREKKIGCIRTDIHKAVDDFDRDCEAVHIAKGGEHHGE